MKNMDLQQLLGKLKALEPRVLFSLLGAAAVVFVALDVLLIMRPQIMLVRNLSRETVQLKVDIDALSTNKQRINQFRAGLDQARQKLQDFKAMVHKEDGIPAVLKAISTIANQYAINIDQLVPQKTDGKVIVKNEDGSYGSLSILIRARGGYHNLGRFLSQLERESVFWQIDALDVVADEIDPTQHVIRLQMKILVLGE